MLNRFILKSFYKKFTAFIIIFAFVWGITACSKNTGPSPVNEQEPISSPEDSSSEGSGDKLPAENAGYIWWEGEEPVETNFPGSTFFAPANQNEAKLSGGTWLTNMGKREEAEAFAKYNINVSEDGEYNLWVRKFAQNGPFEWRFDDQDWKKCGPDSAPVETTKVNDFFTADWFSLGRISLEKGKHTYELRLLAQKDELLTSGFDCFVLTRERFIPNGTNKPDNLTGLAEEGFWPFAPLQDTFEPSPIDLRYLNEEKAGESGFVKRQGDKLVLGSGKEVRFWAVNAGPAIVNLDNASIDYLARHLSKHGVNMVRIHGAIFDSSQTDLSQVDEAYLDKIHYFVSAMKKEGIYTALSFYFPLWVNMQSAYGIEGYETLQNKYPFAILQFNEKFQEIYRKWAEKLLKSPNPYTGVPLADEPAVAIVEVQNEDNYLFWTFTRDNIPETQMEILEKIFGKWLIDKYGTIENAQNAWGPGSSQSADNPQAGQMMLLDAWNMTADGHGSGAKKNRMSDQLQFLVEHQKQFYEMMVDFYRKDLGVKSLISASNWTTADAKVLDALERYTYTPGDIIDRHGYFSGRHEGNQASWAVNIGDVYEDRSVLKEPESAIFQFNQVDDYPHMISETGWPNPNRYKGESVPMWALYGSLQGMDGIVFFAVGDIQWEVAPRKFTLMVPSILGQFPGFALLYRRGDIQEAEDVVRVTHSLQNLYDFQGSPIYETQALDELRKNK